LKVLLSDVNSFLGEKINESDFVFALGKMGFEVEGKRRVGEGFDRILPARVLNVERDGRINWVKVKVDGEILDVATTDEVKIGEVLLWTNVPPKRFGERLSMGMFLSEEELGLVEKSERLARVSDPENYQREFLIGDVLFDVYITPNRPDLLGVLWMAKEISIFLGLNFKGLDLEEKATQKFDFPIEILTEGCDLYTLRLIRLNKGDTPSEVKRKLRLIGFNVINPAVDATNWASYIIGQPLHAFDRRKVKGKIRVVESLGGETFKDLAGREHVLTDGLVLISDEEKVLALGGVIGGLESGTYEDTEEVLLESAHFLPEYIRKAEVSLGIFTESSLRFEKGQSPYFVDLGSLFAAETLRNWVKAEYSNLVRVGREHSPEVINLSRKKVFVYLKNVEIDVEETLRKLEYEILSSDGDFIKLSPPPYRTDIKLQEDVIEEISRYVGYDRIPSEPSPSSSLPPRPRNRFYEEIVFFLSSRGAYQTLPLGLFSKDELGEDYTYEVISDFNDSFKYLSSSPIPHILKPISHNVRLGNPPVPMFCLSRIYPEDGEEIYVTFGSYEPLEFEVIKGFLDALLEKLGIDPDFTESSSDPYLHPSSSSDIVLNGERIGGVGIVKPKRARAFGIKRNVYVWYIKPLKVGGYKGRNFSNLSPTFKDVSVLLPKNLRFINLAKFVRKLASRFPEIEGWEVIDIYSGPNLPEGYTSYTLRFHIRPFKNLTEGEINELFGTIVSELSRDFKIRGK
jgi:phenylalanyl-tRNA synthetase, beta subunit, non-spirochete bacterial